MLTESLKPAESHSKSSLKKLRALKGTVTLLVLCMCCGGVDESRHGNCIIMGCL